MSNSLYRCDNEYILKALIEIKQVSDLQGPSISQLCATFKLRMPCFL